MGIQVKMLDISEIKPYRGNPRNNKEAVEPVMKSIQEFGFKVPIVIDKDGTIVTGHTRYKAATKLKLKEVPCIVADDLTPEQIKAFRLVDNKVGEIATWDIDLLNIELANIDSINMNDFGFDFSLEENVEVMEDDFDIDAATPLIPKSKRRDIYQLGTHRLMCGDSTDVKNVGLLVNGNKMDMVFTDPPYGIDYGGGRSSILEHSKLKNDDLDGRELANLICNVFAFTKDEADVYICVSPIKQKPFLDYLEEIGKEVNAVIVWDKCQPGLGYMAYRRQCEFILFIKGAPFKIGDISDFDLWSISRDDARTYVHATPKPLKVPARALNNSSQKNDCVLDLFGGSGSTLIACEQLDRQCFMMELDPKYVDVIINRWENFTGKKAVLLSG